MEAINEILQKTGLAYKIIDADKIEVAQWVRVKCQFGCGDYGQGACPPNTPGVEECRNFFSEYRTAVVFKLEVAADKDNYPSDWSKQATKKLLGIEREVFLQNNPKTFLLNQTCCCSCNSCAGSRVDCTDKRNSRPSPEGFSVDVYQTLKNVGWDIHVINENPSEINRVAILMVE